jgi:signal transduction histidine kinase
MPPAAGDLVRLAAAPIALAYGFGALAVADHSGGLSTYAGSFPLAGALALAAGLSLVATGIVASLLRTPGSSGDLAIIAGYLWFSPFWVGWEGGPPVVRSLGMVGERLIFPVLLHITLSYPTGRPAPGPIRLAVVIVYVEAIASAAGRALFRDPFFDPFCWSNCTDNVFLVESLPGLARGIQHVDLIFTMTAATTLTGLLIWRLAQATQPARRALWPILPGGLLLAAAAIGHSLSLVRTPLESPASTEFRAAFAAECVSAVLIAAALPWSALRTRAQRHALSRIVTDLGDAPAAGSLRSALGRALGDPNLGIAYWLPSTQRYVDAFGQSVTAPNSSAGRVVTPLVRDGQTVAAVTHATGVIELTAELGAAVQLALENERLRAEVLAQLDELRASRVRIVETGDAHRQRLERDLHDGAQQDLLALLYNLRVARSRAAESSQAETAALFTEAEQVVRATVEELRELASGIYPAVLAQVGLGPALATLAENTIIPIELNPIDDRRYPTQVEVTAYLVVAEAIDDAARRGGTYVTVRISREDHQLVIEVCDDGAVPRASLIQLEDRVGALGGHLEAGPGRLRAEVPCE